MLCTDVCIIWYCFRLRVGHQSLAHMFFFFFQAEDGIRDLVRSRGLGDVYKRQRLPQAAQRRLRHSQTDLPQVFFVIGARAAVAQDALDDCLLYTSDAADERSSVDLGGRRIIKKKKRVEHREDGASAKKNKEHNKMSEDT